MPNFYPISTANKIFHGMLIEHTFIISLPKLQCALIFNIKNIDITFLVLQCISTMSTS